MLRRWLSVGLGSILCLFPGLSLVAAEPVARRIDFRADVAPILQQHCVDCHGSELQMADLRLDERRHALADGDARGLVKAGHSSQSLLIQRLTDRKLGIIMPPTVTFVPSEKAGLPDDKIKILKDWIDQGAQWPEDVILSSAAKSASDKPEVAALFAAIRAGDTKHVAALLSDKSFLEARNTSGSTPLLDAATFADAAMLALLVDRGADVNGANSDGATPLMRAAGNVAKVQLLIDRGAKVTARSTLGRTPLLVAATYPGNLETVRLLLSKGADIKDQDPFGETCLTSAAKRGDAEMVKLLIEARADLSAGQRPPLVWAAEEGNVATLQVLLDQGAGKNPMHATMALGSAAARGPAEAVRLLLASGGNPNAPSPMDDFTALHWAAYSDNVDADVVKMLLDKGGDAEAKSKSGQTPLDLARKHGRTAVIELLDQVAAAKSVPTTLKSETAVAVASADQIKTAAEKALALLESCGPKFFSQSGCVACHQQTVTSLAAAEARLRGFRLDERIAREQVQMTAQMLKTFREKFLQRVDSPAGSAPSIGYLALGLSAENYQSDDSTDAMIVELAGRQHQGGSWTAFGHRPPVEYSRVVATALALRALQTYGPPGLRTQLEARIDLARRWLLAATPASNTEHNFRLLGLAWSGADDSEIAAQAREILNQQRTDGGWAQLAGLESDAYATGLTLFALNSTDRLPPTDAAYQRGIGYLLRTQQDDGSWYVKSRSFPFQPYFESGFPHGQDQWISAMGTGYATVALMRTAPAVKK